VAVRAVIQRVSGAGVHVGGVEVSRIGSGLCCLVGVEADDGEDDALYIARKIVGLRIFDDEAGVMNRDVVEAGGDILLVSQFTLLGDARKGRRPSYSRSGDVEAARAVFDGFVGTVRELFPGRVATGVFQALMDVIMVNHGPVTILLDSRKVF
jgi:D-tyrosyl-tRNA(Tyr) deacylase